MKGFLKKLKTIVSLITKMLSGLLFTIVIIIGGFLVYYFVAVKIYTAKGEDFKPLFSLYTIISPSMEPNIKVYDVIIAERINKPDDVKIGDVITFTSHSAVSEGLTVTHRVVSVTLSGTGVTFQTKGDNNIKPDASQVAFDDIIGKTVLKIPQLGRVQFLIASKGGWFVVVLLPAFGVIIYDIIKVVKLLALKQQSNQISEVINVDNENEEEKKKQRELKEKLLANREK